MQPSDPCIGPASTANLVLLPDITMNQWSSVGMPVRAKFVAGKTYSIGFEYRSASPFDLKLGLSAVNSASSVPGFEVNTTMLPASMADWKTFWSRPFTVTFEQVREFSNLRFIRSSGETDGFEVRSVRILEIPGVQSAGSSTR
jgi:hypothetical protein